MENKSIISAVISMSLDGFIAGENVSMGEPLGIGGLALHEWMSDGSAETDKVLSEGGQMLGLLYVVEIHTIYLFLGGRKMGQLVRQGCPFL